MWARHLDSFSLRSCISESSVCLAGVIGCCFSSVAHRLCAETGATMLEMLTVKTLNPRNRETVTTRLHISDRSPMRTNRRNASIFPEADTSACFYEMLLQAPQCVLR